MKVRRNRNQLSDTRKVKSEAKKDIAFINHICTHYKEHGRHDLVWRKKITPYRILVSEIMLQQTQVARVIPKFTVWMKAYPTLVALSIASLKDILVLWQGLGYQRRAKALYTIATTTKKLPKSFDELCLLPGIGTYTASAIMAFAYDVFDHPVLETNIRTAVIEMYYRDSSRIDDEVLYTKLKELEAYKEVQALGARAWYYALMDYGAHLKVLKVSHNQKSKGYTKQKPYKGSLRQLRAQVLFAITHREELPDDERTDSVLRQLYDEGFIKINKHTSSGYSIR